MTVLLIKTDAGHQAFKERSPQLTGKLRSAFLLFDGQRSLDDVLAMTRGLGVTREDIETLCQAGLLAEVQPPQPPEVPVSDAPADAARTPQERYMEAYPLAVTLTGQLGLSGFRLNLAVEGTTRYEELVALAPRIREAVGQAAYAPLQRALFG